MNKLLTILLCFLILSFGCKTKEPSLENTLNKKTGKTKKIKSKEGNDKSCPTFGGKSKCK